MQRREGISLRLAAARLERGLRTRPRLLATSGQISEVSQGLGESENGWKYGVLLSGGEEDGGRGGRTVGLHNTLFDTYHYSASAVKLRPREKLTRDDGMEEKCTSEGDAFRAREVEEKKKPSRRELGPVERLPTDRSGHNASRKQDVRRDQPRFGMETWRPRDLGSQAIREIGSTPRKRRRSTEPVADEVQDSPR